MKPRKHAEIIKAWADGAQIQYFEDGKWIDFSGYSPAFGHFDWRIKPEPKPDFKAAFKVSKESADWCNPQFEHMPICTQGNLLLTFDGETGQLKSAEVLK